MILGGLGRMARTQADAEPNLYYRYQQMMAARAALKKAEEVLEGKEPMTEDPASYSELPIADYRRHYSNRIVFIP